MLIFFAHSKRRANASSLPEVKTILFSRDGNFPFSSRLRWNKSHRPDSRRFRVLKFPVLVDIKGRARLVVVVVVRKFDHVCRLSERHRRVHRCLHTKPLRQILSSLPPKSHYYLFFENKLPAHSLSPFSWPICLGWSPLILLCSTPIPLYLYQSSSIPSGGNYSLIITVIYEAFDRDPSQTSSGPLVFLTLD